MKRHPLSLVDVRFLRFLRRCSLVSLAFFLFSTFPLAFGASASVAAVRFCNTDSALEVTDDSIIVFHDDVIVHGWEHCSMLRVLGPMYDFIDSAAEELDFGSGSPKIKTVKPGDLHKDAVYDIEGVVRAANNTGGYFFSHIRNFSDWVDFAVGDPAVIAFLREGEALIMNRNFVRQPPNVPETDVGWIKFAHDSGYSSVSMELEIARKAISYFIRRIN